MSMAGLKYYLSDPKHLFDFFASRGLLNRMSDEKYLKIKFKNTLGYALNLNEPKTYNEKLQWLKLHDRNPLYTQLVDKYEVRKFIAEKIGEEYLIPLIGGPWDSVDEINFDSLPEQFVLKCTHDSGGVIVCRDKAALDIEAAKAMLKKRLGRNYYWANREWPYKNVKPRIIAEKYMEDESGELRDYKFFCFNGETRILFIATDRISETEETKFDFFDMDFRHLDIKNGHDNASCSIAKPQSFEKMKELCAALSKNLPHVRVDLYEINGKPYFGEMTLYHWSGFVRFSPEEWDKTMGSWLVLPREKI